MRLVNNRIRRICSKCQSEAAKFHGDRWLCVMHYRFETMRDSSREKDKYIPTHEELEALAGKLIADGMRCEHCRIGVEWTSPTLGRSTVVSLQHDACGAIRFLCMGCNRRHASFPGDEFYQHPLDWKYCWRCHQALPLTSFYKNNAGACCRSCRKNLNKEMWAQHGKRWSATSKGRADANN